MKRVNLLSLSLIVVFTTCTFTQKKKDDSTDLKLDTTSTMAPKQSNAISLDTTVIPEKKSNVSPANKVPPPSLDTISVH